ncbi:glycosyl transferase 2 family protein, partial [Bacteroides fragilis str. 3998T(B)3]
MVSGLVSVIIPTYKRPNMLGRAIDSVLEQSYSNIEVIVVDDNSDGDKYR